MFIDLREREREREEETGKHHLVASHRHPNWGLNLQPFGVQDNGPTN